MSKFGIGTAFVLTTLAGQLSAEEFADRVPVAEGVRLLCDEHGRCLDTRGGYAYESPRYSPGDAYGPRPYIGPGFRPPTKWEQKGFCPPGQRKKGNC